MAVSKEMTCLGLLVAAIVAVQVHSLWPSRPSRPSVSSSAELISFRLLAETQPDKNGNPIYPEKLLAANGKLVRISGFVAPFNDPQDLSQMVITQGAAGGGCFFCAPPSITGVVLVKLATKDEISNGAAVTVEGTLHLHLPDAPEVKTTQFLYILDQSRLVQSE